MRVSFGIFAAILFGWASAALAQAQVPVSGSFDEVRHEWPQKAGALEVRWTSVQSGGQMLICGAVRHINPRATKANRGLLRKGWIKAGSRKGPILLRDLSYFTHVRADTFDGAQAKCRPLRTSAGGAPLVFGFDPHSGYDADMGMF